MPLSLFFMFHCRLASNAYTTIEHCEKKSGSKDNKMGAFSVKEAFKTVSFDWSSSFLSLLVDIFLCFTSKFVTGGRAQLWDASSDVWLIYKLGKYETVKNKNKNKKVVIL